MDRSDAAIVSEIRAGGHEAFQVLVERHGQTIFRLAYRMTGSVSDAEEIVQETFLRAFVQLERFESRSSFRTWLYRIGVNCAIDAIRARPRHGAAAPAGPDGTTVLDSLAAVEPSPHRMAVSSEIQRQVSGAMEQLSAMERAAFILRHFEGRSIEEIGRALNLRQNATKHSIFRAVRKMRSALEAFAET